jgi:hypothetical protein
MGDRSGSGTTSIYFDIKNRGDDYRLEGIRVETIKQIKNLKIGKFKKIRNNLKLFLKIFKNDKMTFSPGW